MNKCGLKNVSIRGRVSFAIRCFENTLLKLNYNVNEWKMVLEYLWQFTSIEYLDDWEQIMCEIIPGNLLEFRTYEEHDFEILDEKQFRYLYDLYQNIDKKIDYIMSEIYNIVAHHSCSSIEGYGESSLDELYILINYMNNNSIPLPDIEPFEKFSISENRGWGNKFDGKSISRIL